MAENSLVINATSQGGDRSQRSVTFSSGDADRDKMLTLARGFNALTTNNFIEAKRIQKVDLDDDPDGGWHGGADVGYEVIPYPESTIEPDASKTTPTITLTPATMIAEDLGVFFLNPGYHDIDISYNGDGTLYVDYLISNESNYLYVFGQTAKIINDNGYKLRLYSDFRITTGHDPDETAAISFTVRATATDTCNQASATFTITN